MHALQTDNKSPAIADVTDIYEVVIYPTSFQAERARSELPSLNTFSALGVASEVLSVCQVQVEGVDFAVVGDLEPGNRMELLLEKAGTRRVLGRLTDRYSVCNDCADALIQAYKIHFVEEVQKYVVCSFVLMKNCEKATLNHCCKTLGLSPRWKISMIYYVRNMYWYLLAANDRIGQNGTTESSYCTV